MSWADALLRPRSIALVGASDDTGKTGGRPLAFLRRAGCTARIYPVNPRRSTVQGEPAWPSLSALPEVPDQVFVLSGTDTVLEVARECARLGVEVLTVLAGGFAEAGPQGEALQNELLSIAHASAPPGGDSATGSRMRILGPSSLGLVVPRSGLVLTANAAFAESGLPQGSVFVASQSGSMIGALVSRGKARGVGFAGLVSVGGEADLSVGDICAATLDDPNISGYLLFLESLRHGPALRAFAQAAAARGKPVVAYKLGRSAAAAEMAATHTGALAGEDDVADAFFRDLGIARVGVLEALLEVHPLARRVPLPVASGAWGAAGASTRSRVPRVGVVTTTGGGAAMVVDQLGIRGVEVQGAQAQTLAQLAAADLPHGAGRVLDLTLAGTRYPVMKGALDILRQAPEFDLIVAVVGSSARTQPELAVQPILDSTGPGHPLVALLVPDAPQALAQLTEAGVACFRTPEACADSIAAVLQRRGHACWAPNHDRALKPRACAEPSSGAEAQATQAARPWSEAQAYSLLDSVGIAHAPVHLCGIDAQVAPALPFAYPVVAKVCSPHIPHKTEVGGVQLPLGDPQALAAGLQRLRDNLATHAPGVPCPEVLIQPLCSGLGEVLLGFRIDPQAGPLVMLASGGIWAEVAQDRSLRLAPVPLDQAYAMVEEVRALRVLQGLRGRPRGDLDALAQAIVALSQLAVHNPMGVCEAEINPLLVREVGQGVLALDALVIATAPPLALGEPASSHPSP